MKNLNLAHYFLDLLFGQFDVKLHTVMTIMDIEYYLFQQ